MGLINRVVEWIRTKRIFVRRRKDDQLKALAVLLYYLGLSCRKTRDILREWEDVSHEAIRQWYHRIGDAFPRLRRKHRRTVAIDETKIRIEKKWMYLWAAMDTDTREILAVYLSPARSHFDTLRFLKRMMRYCSNKPLVLIDRGPWYPWALDRYGLRWRHETFGDRNPIEQWFGIVKHRTKRFWNRFPHNSSMKSTLSWMLAFMAIYNSWGR